MQKKIIVISLGGSTFIQENIDIVFLRKFKRVINKNRKKYKFVIVCGGGYTARKYINALNSEGASIELQCLIGIAATRMNARFVSYFFNKDQKEGIPHTLATLENYVNFSDVVFCGALDYKPEQTSDTTSAIIAKHFNTIFINITNVDGLYNKNPVKFKDAKLIKNITWKAFYNIAKKINFKPGQNFILDKKAAKIIMENLITTYIIGKDMDNFNDLLNGKKFKGTIING